MVIPLSSFTLHHIRTHYTTHTHTHTHPTTTTTSHLHLYIVSSYTHTQTHTHTHTTPIVINFTFPVSLFLFLFLLPTRSLPIFPHMCILSIPNIILSVSEYSLYQSMFVFTNIQSHRIHKMIMLA